MIEPVKKTLEVPCGQQQAFEIFVEQVDTWWPKHRNSVSAMGGEVAQRIIVEPRVAGRVLEIGHDGTEHLWGSVTRYEPHERITLDWHINLPPEKASTVDVVFSALDDDTTRVELTHSNWEAFGDQAADMRAGYDAGWVGVFEEAYRDACAGTETAA